MYECEFTENDHCQIAWILNISIMANKKWCQYKCGCTEDHVIRMLKGLVPDLPEKKENQTLIQCVTKYQQRRNKITVSTKRQIKNVLRSLIKAATYRFKMVSKKEREQRYEICLQCPDLSSKKLNRCSKCGCCTSLKVRLETEHCPENKW